MSSTASGSGNNSRYLDFDEYVDLKLQKTRSTIKSTDILVALAGVAAMFLGYLLVFVIFDQWVVPGGFGIGLRWVLLSTLLILTAAWLAWKVGVPYLRTVNRLFAAREIEKADPDLKSNLLNLVDLRSSGRQVDPGILRALEKNAAVGLQKVDVAQAIDHRPLMRMAYVLLAVVVMFCLYALFSPKKISNSIWRSLMPASNVDVSTRTEIVKVDPGNTTVLAGVKVDVSADIAGEIPEKVWLHYTTADGKFRDEPVELRTDTEGPTRFKGILLGEGGQGVLQDLRYVIRAGDAVSDEYQISVKQPPSATVERIALQFPAYMKFESTDQVGGLIDTWEGTRVTLTARTNIPVKSARVEFMDTAEDKPKGEEVAMSVSTDGRQLTASWMLEFRSDDAFAKAYHIQCRTEADEQDPNPIKYGLTIRKDLPPEVSLLEPVRDLEVPANTLAIPLLIEGRDPDFELSHINLHVKKNGQVVHKEPLSEGRQQRVLLKPDLNLERFALKPGDLIEFWVQAFDNKQPRPNSKVTPELRVKIVEPVSEKEARQKAEEDKANREQRLKDAELEKNPDARPDQEPQEGKNDERQPIAPQPREQDPQPRDPKQEDKGQEGQDPNGKGAGNASKPKPGQGGKDGDKSQQRQTNNTENKQPDQPLNSEGEDDDKALQQIREFLNQQNAKKQPGQQDQGGDTKSDDSTTENAAKPNQPPKDQPQPGDNKTPKPEGNQRDADKPEKPDSPKPKTGSTKPKTGADEPKEPMPGDPTEKPTDPNSPTKPEKNSTANPMEKGTDPAKAGDTAKPDRPKPDETGSNARENDPAKPGDKPNPDPTKPDPTKPGEGTKPEGMPDPNKPEGTGKTEKPGPNDKPDPTGDDPKNGTKPDQPPGAQGTEASPDKNSQKGTTPPKEDGMGKGTTSENKPPKNSPMEDGNDAKNGKTPEGEQKQVPDSPGAEKKQADGNEKGIGTPDRDPNGPKPTRTDNPDVKRDPNQPSEKRPGDAKQNDPNNPAKNPSDNEVQNPKPTAAGQEKQKIDQQQNDAPKSPPGLNPEKRQGDPNAANEPQKGPGQKDQRSKQGTGGEGGSSKEDKEGNPSSQNSGEGDKTDRPGSQQASDKPSTAKDEGKKEPGQGAKSKGGEKKNGGEGGKDGDKSGGKGEQGKAGSDPDKGGEGGEGEGGKPGNDSGKKAEGEQGGAGAPSEGGNAKGGTPGSGGKTGQGPKAQQRGNQVPTGKGEADPDAKPNENVAKSVNTIDEGDEANLEYKKKATELVLKRLQDGLERGDIDPQLLEKLGWTEDQMRQFADRLGKHLQESKSEDNTPESVARRQQFEEMLKSLDVNKQGTVRQGTNAPQREVDQIDDRRSTVPKEYRKAGENFSREITRQKNKPAPK